MQSDFTLKYFVEIKNGAMALMKSKFNFSHFIEISFYRLFDGVDLSKECIEGFADPAPIQSFGATVLPPFLGERGRSKLDL